MLIYISTIVSIILLLLVVQFINRLEPKQQLQTSSTPEPIINNEQLEVNNNQIVACVFSVVSLALYKMYANSELLDYETMCKCMDANINKLLRDPVALKEWYTKLSEYVKYQNVNGDSPEDELV